jgi:hypothetical protein
MIQIDAELIAVGDAKIASPADEQLSWQYPLVNPKSSSY